MNEVKVYEWDFVKQKGTLVYVCNDIADGIKKARASAENFCEDEKPIMTKIGHNHYAFMTNCDFGSIVKG